MARNAVERFIHEHISSVEQLEFLLLMRKDAHAWTAEELAAELRTSLGSAHAKLRDLASRGLIIQSQTLANAFLYAPPPDMQSVIADLAREYNERRVAIITQIYSKPSPDLQAFADAFRLRKPGSECGNPSSQSASPDDETAPDKEKR